MAKGERGTSDGEVREPALSEATCARDEDAKTGSRVRGVAITTAVAGSTSAGMASNPHAQSSQGWLQHDEAAWMAAMQGGHHAQTIANRTMTDVSR
jgi:hypothetical protein